MSERAAIGAQSATIPEDAAWLRGTEAGAAQTVLLVEDEAFVRGVASEILRSAGYRVLVARDAVEAARTYEAQCEAVDLLLTDVVLPGESGRSLAARLRGNHPRLKVLLMTGYADQMERREGETQECLAKPCSAEGLLRKVRQALDGREPRIEAKDWVRRACGSA